MDEAELIESFGLSFEQEASMIAEVAFSVIRDRAVSSVYGRKASIYGCFPSAWDVFQEDYAKRAIEKMEECSEGSSRSVPLYSGAGDLLSQLSRLLMLCRDRGVLEEYAAAADEDISALGIEVEYMEDGRFIRHLRNAVMHCRYEIQLNSDPFKTKIRFLDICWDRKRQCKIITGLITLLPEQLEAVLDILIEKVCLQYLREIGWAFV